MSSATKHRIPSRREHREAAGVTEHAPSVAVTFRANDDTEQGVWNMIALPGEFKGHRSGAFALNRQVFEEIVQNFNSDPRGMVACDVEHASEMHPAEGSIPQLGAPAHGWITKLEIRPDGCLWGLFKWLTLARDYIRSGAYRWLSPAIVFGAKDRVSGKAIGARLSSVALTNNPFLASLPPVMATDKNVQNTGVLEDSDQLVALSALDDKGIPKWCGLILELEESVTSLTDRTVAAVTEAEELRTKLSTYEERELTALVDSAISIWGPKRGHTSKDRDALITLARSNREAFQQLYPPQPTGAPPPPSTTLLAAGKHNVPMPTMVSERPLEEAKPIPVPSAREIADKALAAAKEKGIELSREQAFREAHNERVALLKAGGYAK